MDLDGVCPVVHTPGDARELMEPDRLRPRQVRTRLRYAPTSRSYRVYSHRNTFADTATKIASISASAPTSVRCASHPSPRQIPLSNATA